MEKIRCQICGKPGSIFNPVCKDCITQAINKTNAKIGKRTLEAIEGLDAALETMDKVRTDLEGEN